jgi:hypothetical protein
VREGTLLRDVLLLPVLLPRCALAAVPSIAMPINIQALKKEELLIAPSAFEFEWRRKRMGPKSVSENVTPFDGTIV